MSNFPYVAKVTLVGEILKKATANFKQKDAELKKLEAEEKRLGDAENKAWERADKWQEKLDEYEEFNGTYETKKYKETAWSRLNQFSTAAAACVLTRHWE